MLRLDVSHSSIFVPDMMGQNKSDNHFLGMDKLFLVKKYLIFFSAQVITQGYLLSIILLLPPFCITYSFWREVLTTPRLDGRGQVLKCLGIRIDEYFDGRSL